MQDIELLDADNFSSALSGQCEYLIIYFHAPWCQPCKIMRPVFTQLANKLSTNGIRFGEVNIAISPTIAQTYGIRSVPSIALFQQHVLVAVIAGEMPLDTLTDCIKREFLFD